MKIVVNKCFGGFSVSRKAVEFMAERGNEQAKAELDEILSGKKNSYFDNYYGYSEKFDSEYNRTDPDLILAVETLKDEANSGCSKLKVVEIPDGIEWEISDYDGMETIHEKHRTW
jgi:hypothetical protein